MAAIASAAAPAGDQVALSAVCRELGLHETVHGQTVTLERAGHQGVLIARSRNLVLDGVTVILGDAVEQRGGQFYVSRIDFERRLRPLWRPELVRERPHVPHVIVLDPGHGGWAPGSENKALRVQEKELTLDVALRLRALLAAKGWAVVLTRDRDTALADKKEPDLDARAAVANRCGADVFVSIHFDADAAGRLAGSEIFSFAPVHQFATDDWQGARTKGVVAANAGVWETESPANRLDAWNTALAHAMYTHMVPALHTPDLGERIAHWRVLAPLNCPAVLVEPAYISNPMEALRAYSPQFRQEVAESLAAGLNAYADQIRALQGPLASGPTVAVKN